MATQKSKTKRSAAPKGADFPVQIFADPALDGVKLTRDLSMVGLKLGMDKEGYTWLRKEEAGWVDRLSEDRRLQVMEGLLGVLDHCRAAANLPPVKEPRLTIEQRIEAERNEMFGAMAIVAVTRDSVSMEDNCDMHRALADAYRWLYKIAGTLNEISTDAKEGVCNA